MLNSHPDICCHGEIFSFGLPLIGFAGISQDAKSNLVDFLKDLRDRSPLQVLRDIALYPGRFKAVGVKIKYSEWLLEKMSSTLDWLIASKDIKIIHLKRRNLLRRFVSHQLAKQTEINVVVQKDRIPVYRKLTLSIDQCVSDIDFHQMQYKRFDRMLSGHHVIEICYEDMFYNESIQKILEFLQVRQARLHTPTIKLGFDNLEDAIEDYKALKAKARGTVYAPFFE
jgi:hypothetical protein